MERERVRVQAGKTSTSAVLGSDLTLTAAGVGVPFGAAGFSW
jgi:hypothetical protein